MEAVLKEYNNKRPSSISSCSLNQSDDLESETRFNNESELDDYESNVILPLDEEVIKRHRLTLDEIRQTPRFKDYMPGPPSQVHIINSSN